MKKIELGISGWNQDLSAKSLSWYPETTPVEVSNKLIDCLEKRSIEGGLNARVCLHQSPNSALHEMIICQRSDQVHPPKRHFDRDKTFLVLRGKLLISLFDNLGSVIKSWVLEPLPNSGQISIRIPAGMFHCDFALSDTAVHLETTLGPFSTKFDREYLWVGGDHPDWNKIKNKLIKKYSEV
jgi:cupin fold WbuC family metalloprotein